MVRSGVLGAAFVCLAAALSVASAQHSGQTAPATQDAADYVFRNEVRPSFDRTLPAGELTSFLGRGGRLLDVRLIEDFAADPVLIPGSNYADPEKIASWAQDLPKSTPVAVYCVKGKWVSQKAASYLASMGFNAYLVEGGLNAWKALPLGK